MGPGWYEDQYLKTLGKLSDGPMGFNPWQDPNKQLTPVLEAALAKAYPGVNLNTNHVFTFEALLVAADALKRAGSTDPKALAEAIRTTNITNNVSIGAGIQFDAKGQNDKVRDGATQNRGGRTLCWLQRLRPMPNPSGRCGRTSAASEAHLRYCMNGVALKFTPGAAAPT